MKEVESRGGGKAREGKETDQKENTGQGGGWQKILFNLYLSYQHL